MNMHYIYRVYLNTPFALGVQKKKNNINSYLTKYIFTRTSTQSGRYMYVCMCVFEDPISIGLNGRHAWLSLQHVIRSSENVFHLLHLMHSHTSLCVCVCVYAYVYVYVYMYVGLSE